MKESEIDALLALGYNMAQISQLIKLKNDGIPVDDAFNYKDAQILREKDADEYRHFRAVMQKISLNETQRKFFFHAFMDGLEYELPINAEMAGGNCVYIVELLRRIKDESLNVDITPMLNKNYSHDFLNEIWFDIKNGVDVRIYLNSELPSKKKMILRTALRDGVNIEDDLISFSFLTEKDIPNLAELHKGGYEYKQILSSFKDTSKTLYICNFKAKEKIDPLKFVNKKMSKEVIVELCERAAKKEDVFIFKGLGITSTSVIPLYLKIHELGYPVKKVKDRGEKTLKEIIRALECGLTHENIEVVLSTSFYTTMAIIIDCYKYKQEQYIEYFIEHESCYIMDYFENIRKFLEYNFSSEEKYNLFDLLLCEKKPVDSSVFAFYVKLIAEIGVDKKMFDLLKDNKFSLTQSRIIVSAYKAGYDITCMLDNRLSDEQLKSIKTCLELGLTVTKTKEYDLPEQKASKRVDSYKHKCWKIYDGYYEFEEDGIRTIFKYDDGSVEW